MLRPRDLDTLPAALVELYMQVEIDIIQDMARRISGYDVFIASAQWQFIKLQEMGAFRSWIIKALASYAGKTEREIVCMMEEAAFKALEFDDRVYRRAGRDPPPLAASPALQEVIDDGLHRTKGLFRNLTGTLSNEATVQFGRALDRIHLQVTSGAFSRAAAVQMALGELAARGVAAATYPSGHVDYIEVAVMRAARTGVNQTAARLSLARAEEMGCDLVEVTAHAGARPEHAAWQGKVYSRSGTSKVYPDFVASTGYGTGPGLCGWNCKHHPFPFFEGISHAAYTKAELDALEDLRVSYNGKVLTMYEAEQTQRGIERTIRKYRRGQAAGVDGAAAKLREWQGKQRDFIKQTGLKRKYEREKVY